MRRDADWTIYKSLRRRERRNATAYASRHRFRFAWLINAWTRLVISLGPGSVESWRSSVGRRPAIRGTEEMDISWPFALRFLVLFISFCYSVVLLRVSPYDGDSWRFISVHGRLRSVMEVHPWFIAPPTVPRESRPHSHKPPSVTYAGRAAFSQRQVSQPSEYVGNIRGQSILISVRLSEEGLCPAQW